jgi:hypothetical protein
MNTSGIVTRIQSRKVAILVAETKLRIKACYPVNSPKPTRRLTSNKPDSRRIYDNIEGIDKLTF